MKIASGERHQVTERVKFSSGKMLMELSATSFVISKFVFALFRKTIITLTTNCQNFMILKSRFLCRYVTNCILSMREILFVIVSFENCLKTLESVISFFLISQEYLPFPFYKTNIRVMMKC